MDWKTITSEARILADRLGKDYLAKVEFEIKEIEKQGGNEYWTALISSKQKFDKNKNGLVLPFLFGNTNVDPIKGEECLLVSCDEESNKFVDGVKLLMEDGSVINVSLHTLVNTKRGYVKAGELVEADELI